MVSDRLRRHFGLPMRILPMTDLHTPTTILTPDGPLHFQEYLIRRRAEPKVAGIRFENIEWRRRRREWSKRSARRTPC
jgi:LPPG:FO 2-phospho-L-lactate transferase